VQRMLQEKTSSIWQIQAHEPGVSVTIIGGTHGNERTGVEVVNTLKSLIESGNLEIMRGTLTLIHGNPRAIELNERGSVPHADLNRSYPPDLLSREPLSTYEDDRAREIAPFLEQSDIVLDLHATNKPSEAFLACIPTPAHEQVYRWFPSQKILSDARYVLAGEPVTTDEYTDAHGGVGLCYETGQAGDVTRVSAVTQCVVNVLIDQGLVEGVLEAPSAQREIYELTDAVLLTEAGFTFADGFGEGSWEPFAVGQTLGYHGQVPLVASYDGMLVFPKIPEHWKVGKALAYLVTRV